MRFLKISYLFLLLLTFHSCKKASTLTLHESVDTAALLKYSGNFISRGGQTVIGLAKIFMVNNHYQLKLEDFSTSNGPNLKIYLSKSDSPNDFISLGDIKSTNGNQLYEIQGIPDFSVYKFVLIQCERYNHLFGSAQLK